MVTKFLLAFLLLLAGCGYSTQGYRYKQDKIRIMPVVNKIRIAQEARRYSEYTTYPILIEERLTNRLVAAFNIRSNLEVVSRTNDALLLECEVVDYRRRTLRYTDSDEPEEQRLRLYVKMKLIDPEGEVINEKTVVGQTTFYLDDSEAAAQNDLVEDTARRITEAVVEVWKDKFIRYIWLRAERFRSAGQLSTR